MLLLTVINTANQGPAQRQNQSPQTHNPTNRQPPYKHTAPYHEHAGPPAGQREWRREGGCVGACARGRFCRHCRAIRRCSTTAPHSYDSFTCDSSGSTAVARSTVAHGAGNECTPLATTSPVLMSCGLLVGVACFLGGGRTESPCRTEPSPPTLCGRTSATCATCGSGTAHARGSSA